MECKHENKDLQGTADGIVCLACGKKFNDFAELEVAREKPTPKHRQKGGEKK